MPRPRTTVGKREREIKKRIREQKKQEKAALKRLRREEGVKPEESEEDSGSKSESPGE